MTDKNLRKYGESPFRLALVHGGPGAPGEMTPVARELSKIYGTLEPLQTAPRVDGEVEELRATLVESAASPVVLIGYSWGAWLSFIMTARFPSLVSKLILISSPPFTPEYAPSTDSTRFERLTPQEREEAVTLKAELDNPEYYGDKNVVMARVGEIFSRADYFDPMPHQSEADCRWDVFSKVWPEAAALRRSGELIAMAKDIKCPVVAIHGDYDPHPTGGVRNPLESTLEDFRFALLEKCGHVPWFERQARSEFYSTLKKEIAAGFV